MCHRLKKLAVRVLLSAMHGIKLSMCQGVLRMQCVDFLRMQCVDFLRMHCVSVVCVRSLDNYLTGSVTSLSLFRTQQYRLILPRINFSFEFERSFQVLTFDFSLQVLHFDILIYSC